MAELDRVGHPVLPTRVSRDPFLLLRDDDRAHQRDVLSSLVQFAPPGPQDRIDERLGRTVKYRNLVAVDLDASVVHEQRVQSGHQVLDRPYDHVAPLDHGGVETGTGMIQVGGDLGPARVGTHEHDPAARLRWQQSQAGPSPGVEPDSLDGDRSGQGLTVVHRRACLRELEELPPIL